MRNTLEVAVLSEMDNCKTVDDLVELRDELMELIELQAQSIADSKFDSVII